MIRLPIPGETNALVTLGESTGLFRPGEADALLRDTLRSFHAGELGKGHEVRVWADPADDRPGGWVYFAPRDLEQGAWELYWIGVAPARFGERIGYALLRFVEEHVTRAEGLVLYIATSSLPPLERARRFYVAHGYAVHEVTPNGYGEGDDKLSFVKTLSDRDADTAPG